MKNKNLLKALAALTLGSAAAFGLTMAGCSGPEEENPGDTHEHSYSTEWTSDETGHWHVATCDDLHVGDDDYTKDFAEHVDEGNDGICDICHYVISEPEGEHYVEFELNGHGTEIAPVLVVEGETVSRPADPTADGYTFGGWYTDNHTFEVAYDFNAPVTGTVILYAKWTQNEVTPPAEETYTVTFQLNGHGTAIAAKEVAANGKVTAPAAPTADGYTFGGWYTDSALTNEYDFDTPVTADITLYAKWTENTVTPPDEGDEGNVIILDTAKNFTYDGEEDVVLEFTAPTAGNYTVTVTENSYISVYTQEAWDDWGDPFVDGNETNTGVIKLTEGEKVNLVLQCADPGNYTITITEGGEIVDNSIDPIEVGENSNIDVLAGENGVQTTIEFETEGTYTVTVTPTGSATLPDDIYVMLSGSRMPIILNSENNYTREIVIQSADVYEIMIAHDEANTVSLWILIDEKAESEDPEPEDPEFEIAHAINVSELTGDKVEKGNELVSGSGIYVTSDLTLSPSTSNITITLDGEDITLSSATRLQTGGTTTVNGSTINNALKFVVEDNATLIFYAVSASTTGTRSLQLYNSALQTVGAKQLVDKSGVTSVIFEIENGGTYYVGSPDNGVNIYYIAITYSELNEVTVKTVAAKEATCTGKGNIAYTITSFGRYEDSEGNPILASATEIAELGHDYTDAEYEVTQKPTADDGGYATISCVVCGEEYTIQLPALTSDAYIPTEEGAAEGNYIYSYYDNATKQTIKFEAVQVKPVVTTTYQVSFNNSKMTASNSDSNAPAFSVANWTLGTSAYKTGLSVSLDNVTYTTAVKLDGNGALNFDITKDSEITFYIYSSNGASAAAIKITSGEDEIEAPSTVTYDAAANVYTVTYNLTAGSYNTVRNGGKEIEILRMDIKQVVEE